MNWFSSNILLPTWVMDDLESRCKKHQDDFVAYITPDGYQYPYKIIGTRNVLEKSGAIEYLYNMFPIQPVTDCILYIPGGSGTGIHKDGNKNNERATIMTVPIFPKENYASTHFYDENKQLESVADYHGMPIFMTTKTYHSVYTDVDRYCFQLCFNIEIDEVYRILNQ